MINYAYFVLQMKADKILKSRKGQNTVEYLLMLSVVVGVVLAAGMALKHFMPGLFSQIQTMISGAAGSLGSSAGNH